MYGRLFLQHKIGSSILLTLGILGGIIPASSLSVYADETNPLSAIQSSISSGSIGTASTHAYGDFNGDGRDDMAVGVPFENIGAISDAGAVNVLYGSAGGIASTGNQFWNQDSSGVEDTAEAFDNFGWAVAAGDFNNDGRDDLVAGIPSEDVNAGPVNDAGAVQVFYGSASGLSASGDQFWHQDSSGVEDTAEPGDQFGSSAA